MVILVTKVVRAIQLLMKSHYGRAGMSILPAVGNHDTLRSLVERFILVSV